MMLLSGADVLLLSSNFSAPSSQEQTSRTCFNSNIPDLQSLSMCETYFISVVKADKMKTLLRKDLEDGNLKDIAEKCFLFLICLSF